MNYYEHHIGDYDADTAHLSWAEDMAYTRLLRLYYRREKPIPKDVGEACRLVRAASRDQKQAVESVLHEFFELLDDGWHQHRCDSEIAGYQQRCEHNRRVGKSGGRPRKTQTQAEPGNNPDGPLQEPAENPPGFFRVSKKNPPQTPDTRHQTPNPNPEAAAIDQPPSRERTAAAAEKPPPADPIHARSVELSVLLRQRGAALQASDPRVRAWAESGVTDAQALAVLETAQSRRHEQASAQPINAGYLDTLIREPAPVARRTSGAAQKSFAQQDREAGWLRWEQQTGEVHPDRARCGDAAAVIDVVASPVAQLESAP